MRDCKEFYFTGNSIGICVYKGLRNELYVELYGELSLEFSDIARRTLRVYVGSPVGNCLGDERELYRELC